MRPLLADNFTFFRRQYNGKSKIMHPLMESSALVDIALLFILFIMASSSYVVQPGIKIELPESSEVQGIPYSSLVVHISQTKQIFFKDELVTLTSLKERLDNAITDSEETLLIEADKSVSQQEIINICDIARSAGLKNIAIATEIKKRDE